MAINKTTQYTTDPNSIPVDTSTGSEQPLSESLDSRVNSSGGDVSNTVIDSLTGTSEVLSNALDSRINRSEVLESTTPFGKSGIRVLNGLERDAHYGFNNGILDAGNGKWVIVYRKASNHAVTNGAEIRAVDTFDKGATLENDRLVYTIASADTRNFVSRVMGSGRLGIIASRRQEDLTYIDPVFLYSDDDGVTWNSQIVPANSAGQGINFHGNWIDHPDFSEGYIAYSYASTEGDVSALVTEDNGATWAWSIDVATSTSTMTEVSCSRIGSQDKWIMIGRPSGTIGDPGSVWTSSDPLNFGSDISMGIELVGNPPLTIFDDETSEFWYFTFARRDRGWQRNGGKGFENVFLGVSADADTLYTAGGDISSLGKDWGIISYMPDWASGYMFPSKIDGSWYATFVAGEDYPDHNYSHLMMIGDFVPTGIDEKNLQNLFMWSSVSKKAVYNDSVEVGFGTTGPTAPGFITTNVSSTKPGISSEVFSTNARTHVTFNNPNGQVGSISTSGTGTGYGTTSDGQLKTNRSPLSSDIDIDFIIKSLEPVAYDWINKDGESIDERGHGLIAQDVSKILPDVVIEGFGEPGEDGYKPWQIDYSKLVVYLLAKIQKMDNEIQELKSE